MDYEDPIPISEVFLTRVYYAVCDGMATTLYDLLNNRDPETVNKILNQKVPEINGEHCTPLIVAARYGKDEVVQILLDKFKPDLEQEGTVKINGCVTKKATALWCAAGAGHLKIVKRLIKAGANVNHCTKGSSTPLRAACIGGRLDIVECLMEHGADMNVSNQFNNTCLMIAAYNGHLEIVSYLLEKGANPNEKTNCGDTALHFASRRGHTDIVSKLLDFGAEMNKNVNGLTPLIMAAEKIRAEVVEELINRIDVSKEDIIEAYELLGASFANDETNSWLMKTHEYLSKGMELRFSDPDNVIYKKLGKPVKAYENCKESETVEELHNIRNNENAIHMESLAVRERILGTQNPEVPRHVVFRGILFAESERFDKCIDLWLHALHLKQMNDISVGKDILRFVQVFSQMIVEEIEIDFAPVLSVLESCVMELANNKSKVNNPDSEMESNIMTTLYILTILTKLLSLKGNRYEMEDKCRAHHLVRRICALQLKLKDGQTLLHLAVNEDTLVDYSITNHVCKYPCAATAKLLIDCGADVNALDSNRNTPLHLIVDYGEPISDFMTINTIIMELIEAGAHMDTVNNRWKTPYDAVTTGVPKTILRTHTKLSLKCMAAKAVKFYDISYRGNVPRCLESFIELHGFDLNQC